MGVHVYLEVIASSPLISNKCDGDLSNPWSTSELIEQVLERTPFIVHYNGVSSEETANPRDESHYVNNLAKSF